MKSFRNPKYLDRYEDVVFDLEQSLDAAPANNAHQTKTGLRFVADNTGETTPFDWYNARLSMDFKVNKLADGAPIAANDHNGIVNGSNSFIEKLSILANGREVYSCNYANHIVNIKSIILHMLRVLLQTNFIFLIRQELQRKDLLRQLLIKVLLQENYH